MLGDGEESGSLGMNSIAFRRHPRRLAVPVTDRTRREGARRRVRPTALETRLPTARRGETVLPSGLEGRPGSGQADGRTMPLAK